MSRATAAQLSLFESAAPSAPTVAVDAAPADPDFARGQLSHLLRQARRAERLPWSVTETRTWEHLFPQLAESLPLEEAQALCQDFAAELARLRASGDRPPSPLPPTQTPR